MYQLLTAKEAVIHYFDSAWTWNYDADDGFGERIGPSAKNPGSPANHRLVVRDNEFVSMRWRYESKWMREKGINVPINARSETVFTNGLFKHSIRDRRCLVIVDGFFEPKGPKGTKRDQYLFQMGRPFALGGIWIKYKAEDDEFQGFTIVTTESNGQVLPIHSRMPVILDNSDDWDAWMNGTSDDVRRLCQLAERPELTSSIYQRARL